MASTTARIAIVIDAVERGLAGAAARARAAIASIRQEAERQEKVMSKVGAGLAVFAKGLAAISAVTGAVQVVAGVAVALQNLLPIGLLLPAALLGVAGAVATLKIGMSGVADAIKSGDISKLAPQAGQAVTAIRGLSGEFDKLKRSVQDALFKNFAADVKTLGAIYLPLLKSRLTQIATSFNEMGRSVAFALTRPRTSDDIGIALVNTAKLLHNARNAAGAFISGFTGLAAIGATYLPRLGVAIDGVAQKFQRWVDTAGSDGTIRRMIDGAIAGFKTLGQIAGNVGSILRSVFTGLSSGAAGNPLESLQRLTAALAEFLKTAQAQDALKALGQAFRDISDATRGVLLEALKQLAPIIRDLAPVAAEIAKSFGTLLVDALKVLGPILQGVTGFLRDHKEMVTAVADALFLLYLKFLLFKGIGAVVAAVQALSGAFGRLGLVKFLLIAAGIDAVAGAIKGYSQAQKDTFDNGNFWSDLQAFWEDFKNEPFQAVGKEFRESLTPPPEAAGDFKKIGDSFKNDLLKPMQDFGDFVNTSLHDSFTALSGFGDQVNTAFTGAITGLSGFGDSVNVIIGNVVQWFIDLPGRVVGALSTFGESVNAAISTVASTLWTGFLTTVTATFEPVRAFFSQTPYQMGFAIGSGVGALITAAGDLMTQFGNAVNTGIDTVITSLSGFGDRANTAISNAPGLLLTKGTEIGNAVNTGIGTGIDTVIGSLSTFGDRANAAISNAPGLLGGTATTAGDNVNTGISTGGNNAIDFLSKFGDRANAAISNVPGILLRAGTDAGDSFNRGVTDAFNAVFTFMSSIGDRINRAIGDLGNLLIDAGRAVIDGLLAGIKAGVQAMYDFVSGIAAGIAARKGPLSYDRTVLRPAGLALMSGLLGGLKDGNADVQKFVGTIADQLAQSASGTGLIATAARFTAASGGPGGASGGAGITSTSAPLPVTIPIHIGDEVVRVVRTEIDTSNRSTKRVVRAGAGVTAG